MIPENDTTYQLELLWEEFRAQKKMIALQRTAILELNASLKQLFKACNLMVDEIEILHNKRRG